MSVIPVDVRPLAEAFDRRPKHRDENGCLVWDGATSGHAPWLYPTLWFRGKFLKGHRVSYELANGDIPPGLLVDHICHNTLCVEPSHLRSVTRKQNMENRRGATRVSSTGVVWDRARRKYVARIVHNGQQRVLGRFSTIEAAEAVVVAERRKLFTHSDMDAVS